MKNETFETVAAARDHWQKKGYDAWIDLWMRGGCAPTASICPARYMPNDDNRTDFIRGWTRARNESESSK